MMEERLQTTDELLAEIEELKTKLLEANSMLEAIRHGEVDALVLNKDGQPQVYSMESADYTYRVLIEKFGEGALSIASDGLILYCNDYFSKLAQIPASKITGSYFQSYVDDSTTFDMLIAAIQDGPSKGEIILNFEGRKLHVYVSLTDLHPNVEALGLVVTDLTEKRKNEEALEQYRHNLELKVQELHLTNNNLEQFIHVISHDIKEPLRKILTYSSHLSSTRNELFNDSDLKNLNLINNSAFRLNSLVDDLVKYAFASEKVDMRKVDLQRVFEEVVDDLEFVIAENKAILKSGGLPQIDGSEVQLRQLLANIISNAVKYARKGVPPEIAIDAQLVENVDQNFPKKKFHLIRVSDNGIGMEETHLSKIFTIFQRLHMRNEYSGNGIGLAICKKIMENHSGFINVESKPAQGSVFRLYFPATEQE